MPEHRRKAPHPEWVLMYRQGIASPKIGAEAGVAKSTVRYHLHIAAQADPSIRHEHRAAAGAPGQPSGAGLRNMENIIALYKAESRLPYFKGPSSRERALAVWLQRRRQDANRDALSPIYREGLKAIPGWDQQPSRKAKDEARWHQCLTELIDYMATGNNWPRHKKTDSEQERTLGIWLHTQRMKHRSGELDHDKETRLDADLPGWRAGRVRGRKPLT
ncbi:MULTISPECIES: helicase associated domain-containing protein [unclassified Pseudarthrobacter]|uniref:helicase associated domain-containing protein n=1 Tax=unclassified Pseudarthrobacter TaxID=2647000 RepID=UPI00307784C1